MLQAAQMPLSELENPAEFVARHLGPDAADEAQMLSVIGLASRRALIDAVVPASIGRIYDSGHAGRRLGFRCRTGFAEVLEALRCGAELPFVHDPSYLSPKEPR